MKVKVVQNDFSGGVTGKTGQYKDKNLNTIQNSRNVISGRSKSLRTIPGVTELPLNILPTDKYLNFTFKGRIYHVVYDTLCKSRWIPQSRIDPLKGDSLTLGSLSGDSVLRDAMNSRSKYLGLTPTFRFQDGVLNNTPPRLVGSDIGPTVGTGPGSNTGQFNFLRRCRPSNMWGIPERIASSMSLYDTNDLFLQPGRRDIDVDEALIRHNQFLLTWYQYNVTLGPTHYMVDDLVHGARLTDFKYGSKTWAELWNASFARQDSTYLYTRFLVYDDSFRLISKTINRPRYVNEDSGEEEFGDTNETWEENLYPQDSEYEVTSLTNDDGRTSNYSMYSGDLNKARTELFGNTSSIYVPAVGADNVVLYSPDGNLPPLILNIDSDALTADPTDMRVFYHRELFGGVKLHSYVSKDEVESIKSGTFFRSLSGFTVDTSRFTGVIEGETLHTQDTIRFRIPTLGWRGLPRDVNNKIFSNNRSPFFNPGLTRIQYFQGIRSPESDNRLLRIPDFRYSIGTSRTPGDVTKLMNSEGDDILAFEMLLGGTRLAALNTVDVDKDNAVYNLPIDAGFRVVGSPFNNILRENVQSGRSFGPKTINHKMQNIWFIRSGSDEGLTIPPDSPILRSTVHITGTGTTGDPIVLVRGLTLFFSNPFDAAVARFSYGDTGNGVGVITYHQNGVPPRSQANANIIASRVYANDLIGVNEQFVHSILYLQARLVIGGFQEFPNLLIYSKRLDTLPIEFVGNRIFTEVADRTETTDINYGAVISITTREGLSIRWLQAQDARTLRVGTDDRIVTYKILDPDEVGELGDSIPSALVPPQVIYDNEYFLSENGDTVYYNRYDRNYFSRRYIDITQQLRPDFIGTIGKFGVDPANGLLFIATEKYLMVAEVDQTRDTLGFFPMDFGGNPLSWDIERGSIYMATGNKIVQWNPNSDIPYNITKKPYLRLKSPNAYKTLSADIPRSAKPTCSDMEIHGVMPDTLHHLSTGKRTLKGNTFDVKGDSVIVKGGNNAGVYIQDTSTPTEITSIIQDIGF